MKGWYTLVMAWIDRRQRRPAGHQTLVVFEFLYQHKAARRPHCVMCEKELLTEQIYFSWRSSASGLICD
jgi:hypothetical protein